MRAKPKKVLSTIFSILNIALMVFTMTLLIFVTYSKFNNKTPQVFGYSFHIVVSPSMEDEINMGDLVVGKKTNIMNIKEGDDIIFVSPDPSLGKKVVVHRVRSIDDSGEFRKIYTYGINNHKDDDVRYPVTSIIGKVNGVSGFWGNLFNPITVVFILIILLFIYIFFKGIKSLFKADKQTVTQENSAQDDENLNNLQQKDDE